MKINESGRSMIEMLGVLAIIGVLSVGGIAGYSKAMSKYRVNKTVDQVSRIIANTRILYGSQRTYTGLDDGIINKAKLFPQEMGEYDATNGATNPFAGHAKMAVSGRFTATDDKAVLLTYDTIPEDACIDIATIDWGTGAGGGLLAFGIDESSKTSVGTAIAGYHAGGSTEENGDGNCPDHAICGGSSNTVMTVDDATDACKGESNTLYFKFY